MWWNCGDGGVILVASIVSSFDADDVGLNEVYLVDRVIDVLLSSSANNHLRLFLCHLRQCRSASYRWTVVVVVVPESVIARRRRR